MKLSRTVKDETRYAVNEVILRHDYLTEGKGLRRIERERGIPYAVLRRMVKSYGFLRSASEAIRLQNTKLEGIFMAKYGVSNPSKLPEVLVRIQANRNKEACSAAVARTNLERYGVANVFQIEAVKKKIQAARATPEGRARASAAHRRAYAANPEGVRAGLRKTAATVLRKHGVHNIFQLPSLQAITHAPEVKRKRRKTHEESGNWIPVEAQARFLQYRKSVMRLARKMRNTLIAACNGRCFYTDVRLVPAAEFQSLNPTSRPSANRLLPVVDHKMSIVYGFMNGISVRDISRLDNLCICSQEANLIKNYRNAAEFENSEYVKSHKNNTNKVSSSAMGCRSREAP